MLVSSNLFLCTFEATATAIETGKTHVLLLMNKLLSLCIHVIVHKILFHLTPLDPSYLAQHLSLSGTNFSLKSLVYDKKEGTNIRTLSRLTF